jgi:hypothetical protein
LHTQAFSQARASKWGPLSRASSFRGRPRAGIGGAGAQHQLAGDRVRWTARRSKGAFHPRARQGGGGRHRQLPGCTVRIGQGGSSGARACICMTASCRGHAGAAAAPCNAKECSRPSLVCQCSHASLLAARTRLRQGRSRSGPGGGAYRLQEEEAANSWDGTRPAVRIWTGSGLGPTAPLLCAEDGSIGKAQPPARLRLTSQ